MTAEQARDDQRAYARRLVADWPPLTPDQRTVIAAMLRPTVAAEADSTNHDLDDAKAA